MLVLGLAWLLLLVLELTRGLSAILQTLGSVIWGVFVVDFLVRFALTPLKVAYVRRNWLTVISLALPAVRIFRVVRILRVAPAARGVRLLRLVGSLNRGMRTLGSSMQRRGFGYVLGLTLIVTLGGAAGMHAFEKDSGSVGFADFGSALWWTAMLLTTMGSESWPRTPEGRLLCLFLSIYGFSIFGYFTAALATHFLGRDVYDRAVTPPAGDDAMAALRREVQALRAEILRARNPMPHGS